MRELPDDLATRLLPLADDFDGNGITITIADAARLIGLPIATVGHYFDDDLELASFYLDDMIARAGIDVVKHARSGGSADERLRGALHRLFEALAVLPALCVELPNAIRYAPHHRTAMTTLDSEIMTPIREVLTDGRATGELHVIDPNITALTLLGGMLMAGTAQIVATGAIDLHTAPSVIGPLMSSVLPR